MDSRVFFQTHTDLSVPKYLLITQITLSYSPLLLTNPHSLYRVTKIIIVLCPQLILTLVFDWLILGLPVAYLFFGIVVSLLPHILKKTRKIAFVIANICCR